MNFGISQGRKRICSIIFMHIAILTLLHSDGDTEARPTNPLQPSISQENDTADIDWLLVEQETSLDVAKDTAEDIDWLEREENHKPDFEETSTLAENSVVKDEIKENSFEHARYARNPGNNCIKHYLPKDICGKFFLIPVCQRGCTGKYKMVTFKNCGSKAIRTDCV